MTAPLPPPTLGPQWRADEARRRADRERLGLLDAVRKWHREGELGRAVLEIVEQMEGER